MQNQLFDEPIEVGVYVPPNPAHSALTPLALVDLQRLLDLLKPLWIKTPAFAHVWQWRGETGETWSAVATPWTIIAVRGHNKRAVEFASVADLTFGEGAIKAEVKRCQHPEGASRSTFARLREWAGEAVWPASCPTCKGDGWHVCDCAYEGQEPLAQCQECDGSGTAVCQECDQRGLTLPLRRARLEKTPVNANLLACAFEILAPAIIEPDNSSVWGWRDDFGRVTALRLEGEEWRMIVMPLAPPIPMKNLEQQP